MSTSINPKQIQLSMCGKRNFNDYFGFRATLVRIHALAKIRCLGVSPSRRVILGRDGWLFYAGEGAADNYRNASPLTNEQLIEWCSWLHRRRDWLAQRGITYVFVVAPEKQTVYPEYMPRALRKVRSLSQTDQLVQYMATHSDVAVIDLRPPLWDAKRKGLLYLPLDTHWNELGAAVAYRELLAFLRHHGYPLADQAWRLTYETRRGADLARMIGLEGDLQETVPCLTETVPRAVRYQRDGVWMRPERGSYSGKIGRLVSTSSPFEVPNALVLRDSFFTAVVPFWAPHFGRVTYLWTHELPPEVIANERPQVVVEEMVERYLPMHRPPAVPTQQ